MNGNGRESRDVLVAHATDAAEAVTQARLSAGPGWYWGGGVRSRPHLALARGVARATASAEPMTMRLDALVGQFGHDEAGDVSPADKKAAVETPTDAPKEAIGASPRTDWQAVAQVYRRKLVEWNRALDPAYDEGDLDAIESLFTGLP